MNKHQSKEKSPPLPNGIRSMTDEEAKRLEADPRFQEMMRKADEDEQEGRWTSMDDLVKGMAGAHGRRR